MIDAIKKAKSEHPGFSIFTRLTLPLNERKSIKKRLNNIRKKSRVNFIAIRSNNQEVLNFIAKDSRIDIIKLETQEERDSFTSGVASLASQAGIFIELPVNPLFSSRGSKRSRTIRSFKKIIDACESKGASILLSTDAPRLFDQKNPWQKAITLGLLLDSNRQAMRKIVYKNPFELVTKHGTSSSFPIKEVGKWA